MTEQRKPRAFISCSLREEDRSFVDYVVRMTQEFGFEPYGTVGKFSAAPLPIHEQMRRNINQADCLILAATPRYLSKDIHDLNRTGHNLSEMLHVELGMAVMTERPVLAFVQPDTSLGSFLPQLVQYIVLDHTSAHDIQQKWPLIANYFRSALTMIGARWQKENRQDLFKVLAITAGMIGGASLISSFLDSSIDEKKEMPPSQETFIINGDTKGHSA